jgi:hypothetical protein
LLKTILGSDADFVLRLTTQTNFAPIEERPLSAADKAAGILSDRIGYLSGCDNSSPPEQLLREVIAVNDADPDKPLRLLTSLLELPARLVPALYRKRRQVELFFRWFKLYGNYTRLLSHDQDGAAWSFYVAAIGVTLLALMGNRRPNKYDMARRSIVAAGGARLEDVLPILERRFQEREKARLYDARRRQSHPKSR